MTLIKKQEHDKETLLRNTFLKSYKLIAIQRGVDLSKVNNFQEIFEVNFRFFIKENPTLEEIDLATTAIANNTNLYGRNALPTSKDFVEYIKEFRNKKSGTPDARAKMEVGAIARKVLHEFCPWDEVIFSDPITNACIASSIYGSLNKMRWAISQDNDERVWEKTLIKQLEDQWLICFDRENLVRTFGKKSHYVQRSSSRKEKIGFLSNHSNNCEDAKKLYHEGIMERQQEQIETNSVNKLLSKVTNNFKSI